MTNANYHLPHVLIAGFGDIGQRVAMQLQNTYAVTALVRNTDKSANAHAYGAKPVLADLADANTLVGISGLTELWQQRFDTVFHFAPPPASGDEDPLTANLLAALSANPPKRLIYISTTGVYGDCGGNWVDENTPPKPQSGRAIRRVWAENALQYWSLQNRVSCIILRVPGIYAADRLPLDRLRAGTPAIATHEDSFSNHIHADDLASACVAAMANTKLDGINIINIVDDSALKMGDYLDVVADYAGLPRPPRRARADAEAAVSPMLRSFMRESRRIRNARMKAMLGLTLRYPTVQDFLKTLPKPPASD